ncbi:MAG: hypothetical protein ACK4Z6_08450 [Candidatus Methylomirabilales bacterium]
MKPFQVEIKVRRAFGQLLEKETALIRNGDLPTQGRGMEDDEKAMIFPSLRTILAGNRGLLLAALHTRYPLTRRRKISPTG